MVRHILRPCSSSRDGAEQKDEKSHSISEADFEVPLFERLLTLAHVGIIPRARIRLTRRKIPAMIAVNPRVAPSGSPYRLRAGKQRGTSPRRSPLQFVEEEVTLQQQARFRTPLLESRLRSLLHLLRQSPNMFQRDMAEALSCSEPTIRRWIAELRSGGHLQSKKRQHYSASYTVIAGVDIP